MKLAVITQYPDPIDTPKGGVESVSRNLVEALAKLESYKIDVITLSNKVDEIKIENYKNYSVHRLPRGEKSELVNALTMGKKTITNYLSNIKPDIIHAHDTYGLMITDVNVPKVFTIHGFIYGDTLVSKSRFHYIRSLLWKYFEIKGWKQQPAIISISPYVRERISRYTSTPTIYDIDNPISDDFFNISAKPLSHVIFSAAAICPRKNQLALIKAVGKMIRDGIDVRLRLAGGVTDDKYGSTIKQYIHSNHLKDHVELLGNLKIDEIKEELKTASIFALLSLEENSPMGIEEAMAAGVPVVTSNLCGMPYMVSHGESGFLVNPSRIDDIATRLSEILLNEKLHSAMAKKSKNIATERFHPEKIAIKTNRVYSDCIRSQSVK